MVFSSLGKFKIFKIGATLLSLLWISLASGKALDKVQTFKEWKSARIQAVQSKIHHYKTLLPLPSARSLAEKQLNQENSNLEIAQDLTLTDYVVGYLTKFNGQKDKWIDVANRLSADEIAELMIALANAVNGTDAAEKVPITPLIPPATQKTPRVTTSFLAQP